jgi:MFS family permease
MATIKAGPPQLILCYVPLAKRKTGMMSLINTNYDYLRTMGLNGDDPMVGVIVSVYYLGCAVGSVIASKYADRSGRKKSIFLCLATAALGNLLMFIAGLGGSKGAETVMIIGRVVMGLGVGTYIAATLSVPFNPD